METIAINFHDETGSSVGRFKLHAGLSVCVCVSACLSLSVFVLCVLSVLLLDFVLPFPIEEPKLKFEKSFSQVGHALVGEYFVSVRFCCFELHHTILPWPSSFCDFPLLTSFDHVTGDDAVGVRWTDIHRNLKLYASHASFVQTTAERLGAHW